MKATALDEFLTECRAASTSAAISQVVDQIEQKIGAVHADRAKLDGQLQEAIIAGRDAGKIHSAIAQLDQDVMTLEAARAGFSRKQADVEKAEREAEDRALQDKHRKQSAELTAAFQELASTGEQMRAIVAKVAAIARDHDRTVMSMEARKLRPEKRVSAIARETVGDVRTGAGVTEYGRRADILLAEVLSMNPAQLMRLRDARRQAGRFGESYQARDHAVENLLAQAKDIERKAS